MRIKLFNNPAFSGIFLIIATIFTLTNCTKDNSLKKPYPCPDGSCDATFIIDTIQNRGSYIDNTGTWHLKYSGINYFRVLGETDTLNRTYVMNGIPLIETGYDSNYFYIPGNITWTYPVYSFLGLFTNNNLGKAIPFGTKTYTITQLTDNYYIENIAGYQINKKFHYNHPAASTMLQSYSKYNYNPTQPMVFFKDMIGDEAEIYIKVTWNTDAGPRVEKVYKLKVKFEA
jgi:hypothetical protein